MGNSLIKLTRSNKRLHLLSPPIFKLNGHCFDEIFEYLSLRDLHSLGRTCKLMQRTTGEFFTRNYSGAKFYCLRDGICLIDSDDEYIVKIDNCIPVPGFMHLITWISIGGNRHAKRKWTFKSGNLRSYTHTTCSWPDVDLGILKCIKLNADKLKSVKKLTLTSVSINEQTVGYIRKILPNIEVLELMGCTIYQDFYDIFLQYCKNMRRIELSGLGVEKEYGWLQRKYEQLEHLGFGVHFDSGRKVELSTFFELNPNVRSFSCDESTLLSNKDAFFNCKLKLDTFELKCVNDEYFFDYKPLWDLLCRLHAHGFCKRLHISSRTNQRCKQLSAMPFLVKGSIVDSNYSLASISNHLIEYAEYIGDNFFSLCDNQAVRPEYGKTRNKIFVENLCNVERLYLFRKDLDILLIIQKLKNLKKMKLFWFKSAEILQLDVLNKAREKLVGAQKVTIYVPDDVFLATKWATKNGTTNFSLIEMKRTHSYKWNRYHFYWDMRTLPPGMK